MLTRGVMAASRAILARQCRSLRPAFSSPRSVVTRSTVVASPSAPAAAAAAAPAFKANLDFKFVKENVQLVADNCKARNAFADPARVAALYDEFTRLKQQSDALRASRNENSAAMKVCNGAMHCGGAIIANGLPLLRCRAPLWTAADRRAWRAARCIDAAVSLHCPYRQSNACSSAPIHPPQPHHHNHQGKLDADARSQLIAKGQQLKQQLEELDAALSLVESSLQIEGQRLPNLTHPDVPIGGEDNAAVMRTVGGQREFGFAPKDHVTLGEALGLLDFETAAEVSGSKFYYLKNAAALLELALVNYAMTKVIGGEWGGEVY